MVGLTEPDGERERERQRQREGGRGIQARSVRIVGHTLYFGLEIGGDKDDASTKILYFGLEGVACLDLANANV
jgi:hypothetical protein